MSVPVERQRKMRSRLAALMLAAFLVAPAGTVLLYPTPAHAQMTDANQGVRNVWDKIVDVVIAGAATGVVDAANYFVSNMAYELAKSIMGDCPGQKSCFSTKNFGRIMNETLQGTAATAITGIADGSGLTGLGFDVCKPGASLALTLQLGLLAEEVPKQPRCSFNELKSNWQALLDEGLEDEINQRLKASLEPGDSPLSMSIAAFSWKEEKKVQDERNKVYEWLGNKAGGQGFNDVVDPVSGRVLTPGAALANEFMASRNLQREKQADNAMQVTAGAMAARALEGIAVNGVRVFVQTLTARAWNKLVTGLLTAEEAISLDPDLIFNPEAVLTSSSKSVAVNIAPQYRAAQTRSVGEYDLIAEFTVCDPATRGPFNCVIDQNFATAVRLSDSRGLTLRQALNEGLIRDMPLISATNDPAATANPRCFELGYCETNLKKLRAARVVPVGWEIAASLSRSDSPTTLAQAMREFNNCGENGSSFCHLVDPDWVLKIPPTQCAAMGYGSAPLSSDLSSRREYCVDMRTCLAQDDNGQCVGGWGACTKEKRVWRFDGDICPSYYNSCRTLTRGSDRKSFNYLLNTMERGVCSADNVGCTAYATERQAVSCRRNSACTDPKGCLCDSSVTTGTSGCVCDGVDPASMRCTVASGNNECVTPSGRACRLLGGSCSSAGGCACSVSLYCRVSEGSNRCTTSEGDPTSLADDWLTSPRRFLSRAAEPCSAENDGCTALREMMTGQSLNLIRNGSFEELEDLAGDGTLSHPRYWESLPKPTSGELGFVSTDGTKSTHGQNAAYLRSQTSATCTSPSRCDRVEGCLCSGGHTCLVPIGLESCSYDGSLSQGPFTFKPGKTYTFTASTVSAGSGAGGYASLVFYRADGSRYVLSAGDIVGQTSLYVSADGVTYSDGAGLSSSVARQSFSLDGNASSNFLGMSWRYTASPATSRAVYRLTFSLREGVSVAYATINLSRDTTVGTSYLDAVSLEEGGGTVFHEGYNGGTVVHAKIPPANLGCHGDDDDPAQCQQYAAVCRENEVGCERYTPVAFGTSLTGIATSADRCPAQCVGYDTFKQRANVFEGDKYPVYFIPSTARVCSGSDVGCTEFTNLRTEATSTFSALRFCSVADAPDIEVFYTWEGSDTVGYELKTWRFKRTQAFVPSATVCCVGGACGEEMCVGYAAASRGAVASDVCTGSSCSQGLAGYAPCTLLGGENMDQCASPDEQNPNRPLLGYCSRSDIEAGDIDCREFYDRNGNRHYRRLNWAVEASASCDLHRATDIGQADCGNAGGVWSSARSSCVFRFDESRSRACSAAAAGCRAYRGNFAGDETYVFVDDMEASVAGWGSGTSQSSEALVVGGHSLKVSQSGTSGTALRQLPRNVESGYGYTLTFWARGSGRVSASFVAGTARTCTLSSACVNGPCPCENVEAQAFCSVPDGLTSCSVASDTVTPALAPAFVTDLALASDWRQYSVGPVEIPSLSGVGVGALALRLQFTGLSGSVYLDNVSLRENRGDFYVVKDSWVTPAACDQTFEGIASPQEMLGCRAYRDSKGNDAFLRSLSRLCRDRSVGCAAYYDTKNSDSPYDETYNAVCSLDGVCDATRAADGVNCPCSYVSSSTVVSDACRVSLGETSCRFHLDGADISGTSVYPDRVAVPSDERLYFAVGDMRCNQAAAGCRVMASEKMEYERTCNLTAACNNPISGCSCSLTDPVTGRKYGFCIAEYGESSCVAPIENGVTDSWLQVALRDLPDQYDRTLCREEAVSCEEFRAKDGTFYLKDPGEKVCEYRDKVIVDGVERSGFFRKSESGQFFPCSPELQTGTGFYSVYRNADETCRLPDSVPAVGNPYSNVVRNGICEDTADGLCPCYDGSRYVCSVKRGNTTCGYQGWVGTCEASADRCEEFVDHLDTSAANPEGKPYYYIFNQKLEAARTACSGTTSLVQGCVLLDRTNQLQKTWSAPLSYMQSQKTAQNGPVTPSSCASNPQAAECSKRCVRIMDGICANDDDQRLCQSDADCIRRYPPGLGGITSPPQNLGPCVGNYEFGLACLSDSDCDASSGERCVDLARNDSGCNPDLPSTDKCSANTLVGGSAARPAFNSGNDTNIVLKARLDRECSEWLTCNSSSPVWDEAIGQFKNVCTGFESCSARGEGGDVNECAFVVNQPRSRYTTEVYQSRETGWYGYDASGYTVMDAYPLSYVLPVKIGGGGCVGIYDISKRLLDPADTDYIKACRETSECGDSAYYCLEMEGVCRRGGGGTYEDTYLANRPCNINEDCDEQNGEICVSSYLASHRFGVVFDPGKTCTSDSQCNATATGADDDGKCVSGKCVWRFAATGGNTAFTTGVDSAGSCRAYPEIDSPYPSTVLRVGESGGGKRSILDGYDLFGVPASKLSNWNGANVCNKANDCECDYTRVKYGNGEKTLFYTYPGNSSGPLTYNASAAALATAGSGVETGASYLSLYETPGICQGGNNDGMRCDPNESGICSGDQALRCSTDSDCRLTSSSGVEDKGPCNLPCGSPADGGRCVAWTQIQYLRGWPGFCIDRDRATTVNGLANDYLCNLWLPVEHLSGAPDLANQYREAGFNPSDAVLAYCAVAQGNAVAGTYEPVPFLGLMSLEAKSTTALTALVSVFPGTGSHDRFCCEYDNGGNKTDSCGGLFFASCLTNPPACLGGIAGLNPAQQGVSDFNPSDEVFLRVKEYDASSDGYDKSKLVGIKVDVGDGKSFILSPANAESPDNGEWEFGADIESLPSGSSVYLGDRRWKPTSSWECGCKNPYLHNRSVGAKAFFSGTGELYKVLVSLCVGTTDNDADRTVDIKVIPLLREQCAEVIVTHDIASGAASSFPSVAWTNEVWKGLRSKIADTVREGLSTVESSLQPYGKVAKYAETTAGVPDISHPYPIWDTEGGAAHSVADIVGSSSGILSQGYERLSSSALTYAVGGAPFASIGRTKNLAGSVFPTRDGENAVKRAFAVAWRAFGWSVYDKEFAESYSALVGTGDGGKYYDVRAEFASVANGPRVAGVATSNCSGSNDLLCLELTPPSSDQGAMTVNDFLSGDVVSSRSGSLKTQIKFYAFADKDHMPLRRVYLDYGDGSSPVGATGYYKNHRGCRADASLCNSDTRICGSGDDFDLQPQACDDRYFVYTHTYRCLDQQIDGNEENGELPACSDTAPVFPCKQDGACRFRPRVQVMDNWGICNGTCPGGTGGPANGVCMNRDLGENVFGTGVGDSVNECHSLDDRSYLHVVGDGVSYRPWTEYAGNIVVRP